MTIPAPQQPLWGTLDGERAIGWRNSDVNPHTAPRAFRRWLIRATESLEVAGPRKSNALIRYVQILARRGHAVGSRLLYHRNGQKRCRLRYERSTTKLRTIRRERRARCAPT